MGDSPSMPPDQLAALLRKPEGEAGRKLGDLMAETNRVISLRTYELMDVQDDHRVLEIGFGCGPHIHTLLARGPGVHYTGIDFADTMVAAASTRNAAAIAADRVALVHGSVSAMPFPDNHFDAIGTANTLYFWPAPIADAAEVRRVLKPGATAVIAVRPKALVQDMPFVQYGFTLYTADDARALFTAAGFSAVQVLHEHEPPIHWQGETKVMESLYILATK